MTDDLSMLPLLVYMGLIRLPGDPGLALMLLRSGSGNGEESSPGANGQVTALQSSTG